MGNSNLKKCPWCGQSMCVREFDLGYYVTAIYGLRSCSHRRHIMYPSVREAIDRWNDGTTIKKVKELERQEREQTRPS